MIELFASCLFLIHSSSTYGEPKIGMQVRRAIAERRLFMLISAALNFGSRPRALAGVVAVQDDGEPEMVMPNQNLLADDVHFHCSIFTSVSAERQRDKERFLQHCFSDGRREDVV